MLVSKYNHIFLGTSSAYCEKWRTQFSAKLKREKIICMKVKVEWIYPYFSIYVVFIFST